MRRRRRPSSRAVPVVVAALAATALPVRPRAASGRGSPTRCDAATRWSRPASRVGRLRARRRVVGAAGAGRRRSWPVGVVGGRRHRGGSAPPGGLDGDGFGASIELTSLAGPRRDGGASDGRAARSWPSAAPAAARAGSAWPGHRRWPATAAGLVPGHGLARRPRARRPDRAATDASDRRPGRPSRSARTWRPPSTRPTPDEPVLIDGLTLWLSAILGDDTTSDAIDPLLDGPVAAALAAIDAPTRSGRRRQRRRRRRDRPDASGARAYPRPGRASSTSDSRRGPTRSCCSSPACRSRSRAGR